ncbi:unnamed protein product, partial [Cladocopium goreaui]
MLLEVGVILATVSVWHFQEHRSDILTAPGALSYAWRSFLGKPKGGLKDSVKRKNMEVHLNKLRSPGCIRSNRCCTMHVSGTAQILMIFAAKKVSDGYACFDMQQYHANQAYVVGKTCLMATLFVDMWVAIPMGIFISFLDARLFISHGGDLVDNEVAVLILYIFIPTVAELTARRFIQGLLDAHLMVAGFRKMLKGISDGEFLTDSNFNIHGDAKCLENLLALNAELTGTSFLSWLWDDKEQHAFQQFVWTDKEEESAPGCLRIHLRNSKGQSVALDACHVKVPDLFGAVQYHLIALKEDPEQVIEDRPDAQVAGSLPPQLLTSDQRSNRAAASSSEGSLCSSCIVDSMKELSASRHFWRFTGREMTFLLDGSSEHFDMLEAHLRFNRVTDDLTSAMPHLRKFARPVDWGWLSNDPWPTLAELGRDIAQYIWTGFSQTSVPGPISVGPMFFRMPYDSSRYLLAKHAQLSLASPLFVHGNSEMDQEGDGIDGQAGQASSSPRPIRLYLHLKNFAPGELPHRSNLSGIGEQRVDIPSLGDELHEIVPNN